MSDPIQFRLPLELYTALEEEAREAGVTVSTRVANLMVARQRRKLGLDELPAVKAPRGPINPPSS
jgi:hypothetical protein